MQQHLKFGTTYYFDKLLISSLKIKSLLSLKIKPRKAGQGEKMAEEKTFDIRKNDYPKDMSIFRTLQIFECPICGALTNRVYYSQYRIYDGIVTICPQADECWHHEIEAKKLLNKYPHPKSYKEELKKEIEGMKQSHKNQIKNDLTGNPDFSLKQCVRYTQNFSRNDKIYEHKKIFDLF